VGTLRSSPLIGSAKMSVDQRSKLGIRELLAILRKFLAIGSADRIGELRGNIYQ
jgi:hypothetical protein